jgi:hypothetical protein
VVDYQNFYRPLLRFELKSQLFLYGFKEGYGSVRVRCRSGRVACFFPASAAPPGHLHRSCRAETQCEIVPTPKARRIESRKTNVSDFFEQDGGMRRLPFTSR